MGTTRTPSTHLDRGLRIIKFTAAFSLLAIVFGACTLEEPPATERSIEAVISSRVPLETWPDEVGRAIHDEALSAMTRGFTRFDIIVLTTGPGGARLAVSHELPTCSGKDCDEQREQLATALGNAAAKLVSEPTGRTSPLWGLKAALEACSERCRIVQIDSGMLPRLVRADSPDQLMKEVAPTFPAPTTHTEIHLVGLGAGSTWPERGLLADAESFWSALYDELGMDFEITRFTIKEASK